MSNRRVCQGSSRDLLKSYSELVEIADGIRTSAYQIVSANANVIKDLPSVINSLTEKEVDDKEIDRVVSIARTIGRDTDAYVQELKGIDDAFLPLKDKGVTRPRVAARNYTPMLTLSTRYHDVTARMTETTSELVNDFTDLCLELGMTEES